MVNKLSQADGQQFDLSAYFAAWSSGDLGQVRRLFAAGGSYNDPWTQGPLPVEEIAGRAGSFKGEFLIETVVGSLGGRLAVEWIMNGTVRGADFLTLEGAKVSSVTRYLAQTPVHSVPSGFGTRLDLGNLDKPGAFSLTAFQLNSEEEMSRLSEFGAEVQAGMVSMDGVISVTTFAAGDKAYSVTAWKDARSALQMMAQSAHRAAMEAFFSESFGAAGWTSVWVPERLNALWIRCTSCGKTSDAEANNGNCGCGEPLPKVGYW